MLQFLFIIDPLPNLNVNTDTTLAMMDEAARRQISNFVCEVGDIVVIDGRLHFLTVLSTRFGDKKQLMSADAFDAIFMRKDPPVDERYLSALYSLRCYGRQKPVFFNEPDGIMLANEKLFGQKIAPELYPNTIVTVSEQLVRDFAKDHGTIVLKPLYMSGGAGVLVLAHDDRNLGSALEMLTNGYRVPLMAQAYVKSAREGDKRIFLVGGEAKGAILRVPRDNDHRANLHAGGQAEKTALTQKDEDIVNTLKPHLKSLGLHIVGIDVIGGYLTEINVTSPTGIIEIERLSGTKVRADIIDYVLALIA